MVDNYDRHAKGSQETPHTGNKASSGHDPRSRIKRTLSADEDDASHTRQRLKTTSTGVLQSNETPSTGKSGSESVGHDAHFERTTAIESGADSDLMEIERRRALRAQILAKHANVKHTRSSDLSASIPSTTSPKGSPVSLDETPRSPSGDLFELEKRNHAQVVASNDGAPSAADYDPDLDRLQEHEAHRAQAMAEDKQASVVAAAEDQENEDEDDMFATPKPMKHNPDASEDNFDKLSNARKLDESVLDNWADKEGYYRIMIGELLDNRYAVQSILGKGVFSAVVKCIDQVQNETVAIKVIRNNDVMRKAGMKEVNLLEKLMAADPEDRKHVVRLKRTFEHRNHLCLVFESLSLNLREVLKRFGRDTGINLKAVRAYAQQMFLALSLMRKCAIMHADLKPDNILVSESRTMLKICDLGSASDVSENTPTPYLASRFYRAPEVILGIPYDTAMDIWAIGCTLYEMYTGKILFPGRTNNQMLQLFMERRGKFPHRLLKKAIFAAAHFDDEYNLRSTEVDQVTGAQYVRIITTSKTTSDLRTRLLSAADADDRALLMHFTDFLEKCLDLDPARRLSPADGLKHPFITRGKPG